jgi:hypothetical protein
MDLPRSRPHTGDLTARREKTLLGVSDGTFFSFTVRKKRTNKKRFNAKGEAKFAAQLVAEK